MEVAFRRKLEKTGKSLFQFWLMTIILLFFLLGALQETYQYESSMAENVTHVLGIAGNTTIMTLYNSGAEAPNAWIAIFFIITTGNIYFCVTDIINIWKKPKPKPKKDG